MLEPPSSRFYQAALQSGLIDEAGLTACWERIAPERRTAEAIDRRLARQAITLGLISLWQAQQLLVGRVSGYRIDKYLLLDLLGKGGMGRVFLARDGRLNRLVALKLLSQERMNNPRAIARFRREAKVGAQLQHENLVRVYDEGESAGVPYLVMEHIDGRNVAQVLGDLGPIPWSSAARLARQVALGLEHARLKGLIHRDVNPCNILVTHDGTAKLTDLGLAIDLNDLDNVTRDGATVGTFDYVSPEQARNSRGVDCRADLYSLGCTLYHMISGRVPFPMVSLPEKLYAHQSHDPEPLATLAPDVPEGLVEVIRRMMRKQPDERYQTPADAALALEPYTVTAGWVATPEVGQPTPRTAERSDSGDGSGAVDDSSGLLASVSAIDTGSGSRAAGESFFPLDLGPAEPLAGGLHRSSRSRSASSGSYVVATPSGAAPARRVSLNWVAVAGFSAVLVAGLVTVLANVASSRWNRAASAVVGVAPAGPETGRGAPAGAPGPGGAEAPLAAGAVVIRFRDGSSSVAPDLRSAVARAVRDRAEVILASGSTVRVSNDATLRVADGGLTIRGAATGPPPTIEVAMKGGRPAFLVTANLKLADLVVVVRGEGSGDAPVWQTERDLTCERCVFRAASPAPAEGEAPAGSRLFLAEGPRLTIRGCLFLGFGRPVEFATGPGGSATVAESIVSNGDPTGAALVGPALVVRSSFGSGAGVRLKVQDCSIRSDVLLVAEQFAPASPLSVEVIDSAVWAGAPLAIEAMSGESTWDAAGSTVQWRGLANRYHLVPADRPLARRPGGEPLVQAPTTLDAWAVGGREVDSRVGPLRFHQPPTTQADQPGDFRFVGDSDQPAGADAARVGPRSTPR